MKIKRAAERVAFASMRWFGKTADRLAVRAAFASLLVGTLAVVASCGGSSSGTALTVAGGSTSDGGGETVPPSTGPETGPPKKIVGIPGSARAVVALFPDGRAFHSPDGFNLAGGGSTVAAYGGMLQIVDVVAVGSGVDALLSDGSIFFSRDGMNLGGGGASISASATTQKFTSLAKVGVGLDAVALGGGVAFFSPDGLNVGGGGQSVSVYSGTARILQIVAVGPVDAVVTLFADSTAFYSPNNRDLGGGGKTVSAIPGAQSALMGLVPVGGGLMSEFADGTVQLSPDGKNLAGGGSTVRVPSWNASFANGPFAPRDSASGAEFLGRLWLSGGFADPANANSCFATCSFFDLWSSTDSEGTAWNPSASFATAAPPDPRDTFPTVNHGTQDAPVPTDFYDAYSPLIVWNGELTAIGATVWRSADGAHWARQNRADGVTAAAGPVVPHADEDSHAVVLGAAIFFVQTDSNEVSRSTDSHAALWSTLGAIPGFAPRCGASMFAFNGKIWVEGGGACDYSQVFNDVWSSADGIHWEQSAQPAAWPRRMWPCVATGSDGIVWLAGGYAPTDWNNTSGILVRYGANHADVWYSKDGSDWRQFKADIGSGFPDDGVLEPRHAPTCYIAQDAAETPNLVIVAGTGGIFASAANARVLNSIRALPLPPAATLP